MKKCFVKREIYRKEKKGVTLIEIVISLAILAIMIGAISGLTTTTVKITYTSKEKLEASNYAQMYMETIKSGSMDKEIVKNAPFENLIEESNSKYALSYDIKNVEEYDFEGVPEENSPSTIKSDFKIISEDQGGQKRFEIKDKNGISLNSYTITKNNIPAVFGFEENGSDLKLTYKIDNNAEVDTTFSTKNSDKIIVFIEQKNDVELNFTAENKCNDRILEFYFIKSETLTTEPKYNVACTAGKVRTYSNFYDFQIAGTEKEVNGRVYEITIKVFKKGFENKEPIVELKGYRTFLK